MHWLSLWINFCYAHINKNHQFSGSPYYVPSTQSPSYIEILILVLLGGRHHSHFPVFRWETEALGDWETHPASQWQSLREIISHYLHILKPSDYLFSLMIIYKAAQKWIEINISPCGEIEDLIIPSFSLIFICCWVYIFVSQLWNCLTILCFFSMQFCAGNPKENFSFYCVWSKLNVACKDKWIVNNWGTLVFFENICC